MFPSANPQSQNLSQPSREENVENAGTREQPYLVSSVVSRDDFKRDLREFTVGLILVLAALWTPRPWQQAFSLAALVWIVATTWRSFQGWASMGFRLAGYLRSLWIVVLAFLSAAAAVAVASRMNTLHLPQFPVLFQRYWAYAVWAFVQEFLLLNFFLERLVRLIPSRHGAILAAAALFAFTHLPNPVLMPATLVWGYIACLVFRRYRNLYTPAMAHAVLGISIAVTIPGPIDHNMRVGLGYLTYREHATHHRSHRDHTVSTNVWVTEAAPTRLS